MLEPESPRVQSIALQDNRTVSANVTLDKYFAASGPSLARHNLNVAGVVNLTWGFKLSVISSMISTSPVNPIITGIDLNGAGNTTFLCWKPFSGFLQLL